LQKKRGIRTREGFGVEKTVWYTVFSQKSRASQARPGSMQGEAAADGVPSLSAIKKPSLWTAFLLSKYIKTT